MTVTPAGWYVDPERPDGYRWYDGTTWTDHRRGLDGGPGTGTASRPAAGLATDLLPAAPVLLPAAPGAVAGLAPSPVPHAYLPPPARSRGVRALRLVAAVVAGLLLLAVVAAVAIPLVLQQRDQPVRAALAALSCESMAQDAVVFANEEAAPDELDLVEIGSTSVLADRREDARVPSGTQEEVVLECAGTALWEDGYSAPAQVWASLDADGEVWISWEWTP